VLTARNLLDPVSHVFRLSAGVRAGSDVQTRFGRILWRGRPKRFTVQSRVTSGNTRRVTPQVPPLVPSGNREVGRGRTVSLLGYPRCGAPHRANVGTPATEEHVPATTYRLGIVAKLDPTSERGADLHPRPGRVGPGARGPTLVKALWALLADLNSYLTAPQPTKWRSLIRDAAKQTNSTRAAELWTNLLFRDTGLLQFAVVCTRAINLSLANLQSTRFRQEDSTPFIATLIYLAPVTTCAPCKMQTPSRLSVGGPIRKLVSVHDQVGRFGRTADAARGAWSIRACERNGSVRA